MTDIDAAIARARSLETYQGSLSRWIIPSLRERIEERVATLDADRATLTPQLYRAELARRIIDAIVSKAWANPCLPDEDRHILRQLVVPLHDWLIVQMLLLGLSTMTPPPLPVETCMARGRGL